MLIITNVYPENVSFGWVCQQCFTVSRWTYKELADQGNPTCRKCESKLVLRKSKDRENEKENDKC
jgi:hypothetical protein